MSENEQSATPPFSPKTSSLTPLLSIPQTPANAEVHRFLEKLKALEKAKRFGQWLMNTTGLPMIDGEDARMKWRNRQEFYAKIVAPLTKT